MGHAVSEPPADSAGGLSLRLAGGNGRLDQRTDNDHTDGHVRAAARHLNALLLGLGMSLIPPGPTPTALGGAMRTRVEVVAAALAGRR